MHNIPFDHQAVDSAAIMEAKSILGDGIHALIDQYIDDTRGMLMDIDLSRSAGAYDHIGFLVTRMKSVSAHVGARKVLAYTEELEKILSQKSAVITIEIEEKIDHCLHHIRDGFERYQKHVVILQA